MSSVVGDCAATQRDRPRSADVGPSPPARRGARRRAHLLAVVAAVDAIAERLAVLERERTRSPARARPGSAGRRRRRARRSRRSGSRRCIADTSRSRRPPASVAATSGASVTTRAEHDPRAVTGHEHVGVLAVPADAGAVRDGPIDQRVVVGHDARDESGRAQHVGHRRQRSRSTRSYRARRSGQSGRGRRRRRSGPASVGHAPATMLWAPSRMREGSVERAGLRYVNCIDAARPSRATLLEHRARRRERLGRGDADGDQSGGAAGGADGVGQRRVGAYTAGWRGQRGCDHHTKLRDG